MREKYKRYEEDILHFIQIYDGHPRLVAVDGYLNCLISAKNSGNRNEKLRNLFRAKALKDKYGFKKIPSEVILQAEKQEESARKMMQRRYQNIFDLENYAFNFRSERASYERAIAREIESRQGDINDSQGEREQLCEILLKKWE